MTSAQYQYGPELGRSLPDTGQPLMFLVFMGMAFLVIGIAVYFNLTEDE